MRATHWKLLLQYLNVSIEFQDLTVKDLWDVDLILNQRLVDAILDEANEEYLFQ